MQDQRDLAIRMAKEHAKQIEVTKQALGSPLEREKQWKEESLEQARLLGKGGEREARLITERDHYKQALEQISSSSKNGWIPYFRSPAKILSQPSELGQTKN